MWLIWASLITHFLVATTSGLVASVFPCQQPVPPANSILAQLGSNVTLPCLKGDPQTTSWLHWQFEGQNLSFSSSKNLSLPSVHYNNSGWYSCLDGNRVLCTLRLIVEDPPEAPDFTCFQKSLARDILCEWRTSTPMSLRTKARLWMRRFPGENHTEQQCRYYSKSQKFSCRIRGLNNEDDTLLLVDICLANWAGTARSNKSFHTDILLKPDPPVNVVVKAVEKDPHKLHITWMNPRSWGSKYYHLQFQLRYRAENSKSFSEVHLKHGVNSYTIVDAVQNFPHIIQVRGREEFDHGNWSEWSRENIGIPWTEPQDLEPETTPAHPQFPFYQDFASPHTSTSSAPAGNTEKPTAVKEAMVVPLHTFLIMAVSITLGLALVVGIIARYRKKWGVLPFGDMKPNPVTSYSLAPLSPELPLSASLLLSAPTSPFSESSADSPHTQNQSPYDVSNTDYFLLPE